MAALSRGPVRALLFDFDGLILDTETPEYESWREVYAAHGCELSLDLWCDCVGRPVTHFDPHAELERRLGRAIDREPLRQTRRARFYELLGANATLPGVENAFREAREMGLRTAVVSSSERRWVEPNLERLRLLPYVELLVCREDTTRHKPDPEPYREAMRRLGVTPREAVAFEDSAHGVAAAKAAGAYTVAVPNPVTRGLDLSAADLCCVSLAEWPLRRLLDEVSRGGA